MTGTLTGVVVTYAGPAGHSVEPPKFDAVQGQKISDPFRVGSDVDAVSRLDQHRRRPARSVTARAWSRTALPEAAK
jgi:hypothetical protein